MKNFFLFLSIILCANYPADYCYKKATYTQSISDSLKHFPNLLSSLNIPNGTLLPNETQLGILDEALSVIDFLTVALPYLRKEYVDTFNEVLSNHHIAQSQIVPVGVPIPQGEWNKIIKKDI